MAYVDWVDISIVVAVHVAIREEAVREEGKKDKLRKSKKLIAREREASAAAILLAGLR